MNRLNVSRTLRVKPATVILKVSEMQGSIRRRRRHRIQGWKESDWLVKSCPPISQSMKTQPEGTKMSTNNCKAHQNAYELG